MSIVDSMLSWNLPNHVAQMVSLILFSLIPDAYIIVLLVGIVDLDGRRLALNRNRRIVHGVRVKQVKVHVLIRLGLLPIQVDRALLL